MTAKYQPSTRSPGAEIDKDPEPENTERPTLTKAIMSPSISQTAQDYDYVIADCNLENEILFDLGRSAQKFIINGTSEERCLRILSSNPWPKIAVKLEESEVNALMEFSEVKTEQQLKDVLSTEQLLIHRPRKGWTLHTHSGRRITANITPQEHQTNCSGTGDAALAALVQAMSMGITDPTEQINDAIAAHLEEQPHLASPDHKPPRRGPPLKRRAAMFNQPYAMAPKSTQTRDEQTHPGKPLHKHPDKIQTFKVPYGTAHIYGPEYDLPENITMLRRRNL